MAIVIKKGRKLNICFVVALALLSLFFFTAFSYSATATSEQTTTGLTVDFREVSVVRSVDIPIIEILQAIGSEDNTINLDELEVFRSVNYGFNYMSANVVDSVLRISPTEVLDSLEPVSSRVEIFFVAPDQRTHTVRIPVTRPQYTLTYQPDSYFDDFQQETITLARRPLVLKVNVADASFDFAEQEYFELIENSTENQIIPRFNAGHSSLVIPQQFLVEVLRENGFYDIAGQTFVETIFIDDHLGDRVLADFFTVSFGAAGEIVLDMTNSWPTINLTETILPGSLRVTAIVNNNDLPSNRIAVSFFVRVDGVDARLGGMFIRNTRDAWSFTIPLIVILGLVLLAVIALVTIFGVKFVRYNRLEASSVATINELKTARSRVDRYCERVSGAGLATASVGVGSSIPLDVNLDNKIESKDFMDSDDPFNLNKPVDDGLEVVSFHRPYLLEEPEFEQTPASEFILHDESPIAVDHGSEEFINSEIEAEDDLSFNPFEPQLLDESAVVDEQAQLDSLLDGVVVSDEAAVAPSSEADIPATAEHDSIEDMVRKHYGNALEDNEQIISPILEDADNVIALESISEESELSRLMEDDVDPIDMDD